VLQVITEFTNFPIPRVTARVSDEIDFGSMSLAQGAAFALGAETNRVPVTRHWLALEGRQCLVEQVSFRAISDQLDQLPPAPPGPPSLGPPASPLNRVALGQTLPAHPLGSPSTSPLVVASAPLPGKGFLIDYKTVSGSGSYIFQGDTTYYVSA